MFTQLIDGARSLRIPLLLGLSTLFTAWMCLQGHLPTRTEVSPFTRSLVDLADGFSPSVQVAAITFACTMVGGFLDRAFVSKLISWFSKLSGGPDWDRYIEEALEYVQRFGSVVSDKASFLRSFHYEADLYAEVGTRRREKSEAHFRHAMTIAATPPAITIAVKGNGWWITALTIPVFALIDGLLVDKRAVDVMLTAHRASLQGALDTREEEGERFRKQRLSMSEGTEDFNVMSSKIDKCDRQQRDYKHQLSNLDKNRFRKSRKAQLRSSQCLNCGQVHG